MKKLPFFVVITLFCSNLLLYFFSVHHGDNSLYAENALMENVQAILGLVGTVFGIVCARKNDGLIGAAGWACAVLGWSIFLREVDVERLPYDLPAIVVWLGHGIGRNMTLLALWLVVAWKAKQNFATFKQHFKALMSSQFSVLMLTAFVLLILSDLFEKSILIEEHHVFYEELMELNAFALFALATMIIAPSLTKALNSKKQSVA